MKFIYLFVKIPVLSLGPERLQFLSAIEMYQANREFTLDEFRRMTLIEFVVI